MLKKIIFNIPFVRRVIEQMAYDLKQQSEIIDALNKKIDRQNERIEKYQEYIKMLDKK